MNTHKSLHLIIMLLTFSTASKEALFFPLAKNSDLALAQGVLSPAVRAGRCFSPSAGGLSSSKIFWNVLNLKKKIHFVKKKINKK